MSYNTHSLEQTDPKVILKLNFTFFAVVCVSISFFFSLSMEIYKSNKGKQQIEFPLKNKKCCVIETDMTNASISSSMTGHNFFKWIQLTNAVKPNIIDVKFRFVSFFLSLRSGVFLLGCLFDRNRVNIYWFALSLSSLSPNTQELKWTVNDSVLREMYSYEV